MDNFLSPRVSVGIPTYNQPGYLSQAIQSVLNQTFQDFEIVIVDDCSTDNTPDVVQQFNDPRIRYYRTQVNLRPPKSWNECVRLAQGELFAILPHDDVWLPDFLETMVRIMQNEPELGFSQCNFYPVDRDLIIRYPNNQLQNTKYAKGLEAVEWHLRNLKCNPAAILFRTKYMKRMGLWREDYWDDWAFIIRMSYTHGFHFIPTYHSVVRDHGNNLSKVLDKEDRLGGSFVLDQLFDVFGHTLPQTQESLDLYSKFIRLLSISLFFTAIKLTLQGDSGRGCRAYSYSRKINPRIPLDFGIIVRIFSKVFKHQIYSRPNIKVLDQDAQKSQIYLRRLIDTYRIKTN